jgi:WD40 repeat protein
MTGSEPAKSLEEEGKTPLAEIDSGHKHRKIRTLAFSADGRLIASGSGDPTVRLANVPTQRAIAVQPGSKPPYGVTELAFSPDGDVIASVSRSERPALYFKPLLWHLPARKLVRPCHGKGLWNRFTNPVFTPDGRTVAFACDVVRFFAVDSGDQVLAFPKAEALPTALRFFPDGKMLLAGDDEGTLHVWDAHRPQLTQTLEQHSSAITCVAVTADGKRIASADDRTICLWDLPSGRLRRIYTVNWGTTSCLVFLSGEEDLVSTHAVRGDLLVYRWSPHTDAAIACREAGMTASAVAISPDGQYLATGDRWCDVIQVWPLADVVPPATPTPSSSATHVPRSSRTSSASKASVNGRNGSLNGHATRGNRDRTVVPG